MNFTNALVKGTLKSRYKRFLADIELEDGTVVTAHCANPGSMLGLKQPGSEVWVSPVPPGSTRKLVYDWQLVRVDEALVGINTSLPNQLVDEALRAGRIKELLGYDTIRREVPYGNRSRVDFILEKVGEPPCYLEVKNVHLKRHDKAEFPDSVTKRGTKHLQELEKVVQQGARAVMLYVVQRGDCQSFALAADIDPDYAAAAQQAYAAGVEKLCYYCYIHLNGIEIAGSLAMDGE